MGNDMITIVKDEIIASDTENDDSLRDTLSANSVEQNADESSTIELSHNSGLKNRRVEDKLQDNFEQRQLADYLRLNKAEGLGTNFPIKMDYCLEDADEQVFQPSKKK